VAAPWVCLIIRPRGPHCLPNSARKATPLSIGKRTSPVDICIPSSKLTVDTTDTLSALHCFRAAVYADPTSREWQPRRAVQLCARVHAVGPISSLRLPKLMYAQ
jgi:hypothetical protein